MSDKQGTTNTNGSQGPQFSIQRVYVKDLSLEVPGAPQVFQQDWHPEVHLDLHTAVNDLQEGAFEVVLTLTVNVKSGGNNAFLIQVQQAGIFAAQGFPADQLDHLLKSYCPSVLFPYARERVTDLANCASFPQLVLAPVNFDALYMQHLEQQKQEVVQ